MMPDHSRNIESICVLGSINLDIVASVERSGAATSIPTRVEVETVLRLN